MAWTNLYFMNNYPSFTCVMVSEKSQHCQRVVQHLYSICGIFEKTVKVVCCRFCTFLHEVNRVEIMLGKMVKTDVLLFVFAGQPITSTNESIQNANFFISQPNHMVWPLVGIVSERRFQWGSHHKVWYRNKKVSWKLFCSVTLNCSSVFDIAASITC